MKGYSFDELVKLAMAAVKRAGDTMTGNLTAPAVLVSSTQNTSVNALTRKDYVDSAIAAGDVLQVSKTGDTMTGILAITDRDSAGAFGVKRLSASQFANYGQSGDSGGEVLLGVGPTVEDFSAYLKVGVDKLTFQNGSSTEKKVYHEGFKPTAADVGARPSNWLPSLEEIGAASTGSVDALQTAGSASFVYEGGALTQMTEQLPSGTRVTAYSYTEGQLTKAVETFGQLARTTTYTYLAGVLTGFTTTEGGA